MIRVQATEVDLNGIVHSADGLQGLVMNVTVFPDNIEVEVQTDTGRETWLFQPEETVLYEPSETDGDWLGSQETVVRDSFSARTEPFELEEPTIVEGFSEAEVTKPDIPSTQKKHESER